MSTIILRGNYFADWLELCSTDAMPNGVEGLRFDRAHFKGFGESSDDFEVVLHEHFRLGLRGGFRWCAEVCPHGFLAVIENALQLVFHIEATGN